MPASWLECLLPPISLPKAAWQEATQFATFPAVSIALMVVTGANDPRVPASEADQMIDAVRLNGGEAWHLLAENEGHGFRKKENSDYQYWASILFWQRHLLGNKE